MFLDSILKTNNKKNRRKDKCSLPVRNQKNVWIKQQLSGTSSSASRNGSLTVEAACVLPVFLYLIIAILSFIPLVSLQGSIMASFWQTGKELGIYAYALESGEGSSGIVSGLLTSGYARGKVLSALESQKVLTSVIRGGMAGISFEESSFLEKEMIKLKASYFFSLPVPLFHLKDIRMIQEVSVRAWTGRKEGAGQGAGTEQDCQMVYVTAEGRVYHKDENCSHIRLSVRKIDKEQAETLRNKNGGKYYSCEKCGKQAGKKVYITDTGDRYHSSVGCSGLKRSVMKVSLSGLEGWRVCVRCGGS